MKRAARVCLTFSLTIAALSLTWLFSSSPSADAQGANPWTLGIVDASFIWNPPPSVPASIDSCAAHLAKQNGYNAANASRGTISPLQVCLVRTMHEHGASKNAVAFTKWFYATPDGDSAYITSLAKPQYGPVQLAGIFYPGRANNNGAYLFVNGTNPRVVDPNAIFARDAQPWEHNADYHSIRSAHPHAFVYPALSFVGLTRRDGGGQRFTFTAWVLDGCHGCARLGIIDLAFEFGNLGAPKDAYVVAVRRCSASGTECK